MKKILLTICVLQLLIVCNLKAQKQYGIYPAAFYNLENLFDTIHDEGKNDYEYLPNGTNKWNGLKYEHKLKNMSTALSELGTELNGNKIPYGCVFIGVAEIENSHVLDDLISQPALKNRGYKYAHVEGPDKRGVDCALLYNPRMFTIDSVKLVPYVYTLQQDIERDRATRGFLTVSGKMADEHVAVIVCHLPSRFTEEYYRIKGGEQIRAIKDSLQKDDPKVKIFIMGDMNDDPQDKCMAEALGARRDIQKVELLGLYNPFWNTLVKDRQGSLYYDGQWNLFDQIIITQNMLDVKQKRDYKELTFYKHQVFKKDYLFQTEGKYKGYPKRTHAGGVWLDGYSDHLPSVVFLIKEK